VRRGDRSSPTALWNRDAEATFSRLHAWRDRTARAADERADVVLPSDLLCRYAAARPENAAAVRRVVLPLPPALAADGGMEAFLAACAGDGTPLPDPVGNEAAAGFVRKTPSRIRTAPARGGGAPPAAATAWVALAVAAVVAAAATAWVSRRRR